MASEWPLVCLDDVADPHSKAFTMGPFGSKIRSSNYVDSGVPVLRGGNIQGERFTADGFAFLTEAKAEELSGSQALPGDIVFAAQGSVGSVGLVPTMADYDKFVLSQNLMRVRVDTEKASPLFVFYYFRSPAGQHEILSYVNPTGVPCVSRPLTSLRSFRVPLPPLDEQRRIAGVLGALDDKIELNRKMNRTLEEMAQAIFKSWFIDFDGVPESEMVESELGPIPKGWEVCSLGDLAAPTVGGDWGKDEEFKDSIAVRSLRGVDIGHLRQSGGAEPPLRWLKRSSLGKRALQDTDVLIAASGAGPCGRPLWCAPELASLYTEPLVYSNFVKRLRCETVETAVYVDRLLHGMRRSREVWDFINGTSVPNLDLKGLLAGKQVLRPPAQRIREYFCLVRPILSRLYAGESRTLADLRDALLPKLISGEIRVPEAEKAVEAVA